MSGSRHRNKMKSAAEAQRMCAVYDSSTMVTQRVMVERFNVSASTCQRILAGEMYDNVVSERYVRETAAKREAKAK
jgi:hypothetical protein